MLAEDVFAQRFGEAVGRLERLMDDARPFAEVVVERNSAYWRGRMTPHLDNACAFECVLHKNQTYDLEMGALRAERRAARDLNVLAELADAAIRGRAYVRHSKSQATGVELARELRVPLLDGSVWTLRHAEFAASAVTERQAVLRDRYFVAYQR